jgi:hypothetical protein
VQYHWEQAGHLRPPGFEDIEIRLRDSHCNIGFQCRLALKGFDIGNDRLCSFNTVTIEDFLLEWSLDILRPVNQAGITVLRQLFDLKAPMATAMVARHE